MTITLKNLHEKTKQEVFEHVVTALLKQNKRSMGVNEEGTGTCLYRSSDGSKCAAGHCIGDDEYNPRFEGNTWGCLIAQSEVTVTHGNLISRLQRFHDEKEPFKWWGLFKDFGDDPRQSLSTEFMDALGPG